MDHPTPAFAKLKPDSAKFYPAMSRDWMRVVSSNDLGVRVDLGGGKERFVSWLHIETKEE